MWAAITAQSPQLALQQHGVRVRASPLDPVTPTFDQPWWARVGRSLLRGFPREIVVCSPCVGLNAPERAALELQVPWRSVDMFDINGALRPVLQRLGNGDAHLGDLLGDLMLADPSRLSNCDAIVSGPPCPPFSTIGKRMTDKDVRASVFVRVGLWVVELAHRQKPLSFFVFENVEGVLKRAKQDSMPFAHWFSSEMMRMLPQGWDIKIQRHNSKHCGVAQSRPRVFIVGTGPAMHRTLFQRMVLGAPLTSFPPVSLMHFLELEADDQDFDN